MLQHMAGRVYDDVSTKEIIKKVYDEHDYLLCPHSAIGYEGLNDYLGKESSDQIGIFISTASPAKFGDIVEPIIGKQVDIPERLLKIVEREKNAIAVGNEFEDLKAFLLS